VIEIGGADGQGRRTTSRPGGLRRPQGRASIFLLTRERARRWTQVVAWAASNGESQRKTPTISTTKRRLRQIDRRIRYLHETESTPPEIVDPEAPRAGRDGDHRSFFRRDRALLPPASRPRSGWVSVRRASTRSIWIAAHISWLSPPGLAALMKSGVGDRVMLHAPGGNGATAGFSRSVYQRILVQPFSEPPGRPSPRPSLVIVTGG